MVHVEAAGVGAWDPFEREGGFVEVLVRAPKFPYVLGTDGAGTVSAVGEKVKEFKEGDRVYALELGNPKGVFMPSMLPSRQVMPLSSRAL